MTPSLSEAAWQTLKKFGMDPKHLGAQTGMIAILHTWGQTLTLHPHLHCIVPGGGLTERGKWKMAKSDGKYLFPVKSLSKAFRGKFMDSLKAKNLTADKQLINALYKKEWVIYAKQPFGNPHCVIEYLGRYTHKIAISNHRIKSITPDLITFSYKDYKHGDVKKEMSLSPVEFIRRFSMHIMPRGFVRIRHFGILSSTGKKKAIPLIKEQFPKEEALPAEPRILETYNPKRCPHCKTETMINLEILPKRGPPSHAALMETVRMEKK